VSVVRETRPLRSMWRGLETRSWQPDCGPPRKRWNHHRRLPSARQSSTLLRDADRCGVAAKALERDCGGRLALAVAALSLLAFSITARSVRLGKSASILVSWSWAAWIGV